MKNMKSRKIKFGFILIVFTVATMLVGTNSAKAFNLFNTGNSNGNLGDLFVLDKLFSDSQGGILSSNETNLGDLFILNQLFSDKTTPTPVAVSTGPTISERLSGKILLQVEENGEAWYVDPSDNKRISLGDPNESFAKMGNLGIGITSADFNDISTNGVPERLVGKFLLKVEDSGKLFYVNPTDNKIVSVGTANDVVNFISQNGIGISNNDLELIAIAN